MNLGKICCLFLVGSAICLAQQIKPVSPLPPGAFSFAGKWNCEGTFRQGKPHQASFAGSVILDGKWIQLDEEDVLPATGYKATYLIGYDPQQKCLVEFDANNFGAAVFTGKQGWQSDSLTLTSAVDPDAKAPYAVNRFVYSISGSDSFTIDWQISRTSAPLDWISADHLSCQRKSVR